MVNVETTSAEGRNKEGKIREKRKRDADVEATSTEGLASHAEGGAEDGENRKKRKRVKDGTSVDSVTDGNNVRSGADSLNKIETEKSDTSNERKKKKRKHTSLHGQPQLQEAMNEKVGDVGVVAGDNKADGRKGRLEKSVEEGIGNGNSEQSIDRKKEKKKKKKKHNMDEWPVLQEVPGGDNHASGKDIRHARDAVDETVTENYEDPNDRKKEKKKKKQRIEQEAVSQEAPVGDNEANRMEVDKASAKNSESLEDRKKKKKNRQRVELKPVSQEAPEGDNQANTKEVDKATTKNSKASEDRKKKDKQRIAQDPLSQETPVEDMESSRKEVSDKAITENSEYSEGRKKEKKKKKNQSIDQEQPARPKSGRSGGKRVEKDAYGSSPPKSIPKRVRFSDVVQVIPIYNDEEFVRGKPFSLEEDELIKAAVFEYIKSHALGDEGVNMIMNCRKHKETRNCWQEIRLALPRRPRKSIISRAHIIFERSEDRKWTPEERDFVLSFHGKNGPDWKTCGVAMGKSRIHVKDTFRRLNVKNPKSGRWSQDEYQGLFDLVNTDLRMKVHEEERKSKHGMLKDNISWAAISDKLNTRSQQRCCSKWYRQLASPMVAAEKWLDTDDYLLVMELYNLDACCMEDVDWDDLLEHRSGELCRMRWNQMVKHLGDTRDKSFAEQVDILSKRYCFDVLEAKEAYYSKPLAD